MTRHPKPHNSYPVDVISSLTWITVTVTLLKPANVKVKVNVKVK